MPKIDTSKLDVAQIFLTYMSLVGCVEKVAAALDLDPAIVQGLADEFGWDVKIRRVSLMSKSGKPGDYERAQNRALNFVQAHRLRLVLDKLIAAYSDKTPEEAVLQTSNIDKEGIPRASSRFFADLAAAMEKVQALSYAALGDSLKERTERSDDNDGGMTPNQLHAAVIAALNNGGVPDPKALIAEQVPPADFAQCERTPVETPTEPSRPSATE
ncbi:MAG: hypothetical protein HOO67_05435 [Candidatus Peribacteraceae bacterium]|nr:hypothetical protein [Candidatus Peribacteraceae bacterium]